MRSNFNAKQFVRAKGEDANVHMCHLSVGIEEPKHKGGHKRWEDASCLKMSLCLCDNPLQHLDCTQCWTPWVHQWAAILQVCKLLHVSP